jgi:diacylglycerol O-acyltransferase/trehalose O-mycolyltransferase
MPIVTRCSRRRLLAGWLALLVAAPSAAGCGGSGEPGAHGGARRAFVSREVRVAPRLIDLSIRSPALGRTAMVRLLTPDGWSSQRSDRRWPVLYLLHGCCDDYESWTRSTEIERVHELRKLLVVMPEAGPVGFYANWRDANGPQWETFHLTELRQILERDYGAGGRRAVAGLSMGGLGAIGYAARHPGYFKAAASFSGILHPLQDPDFLLGLFAAFTPDPRAIWGDPTRQHEIWARHDPTELAARLRGTALFVSAGDGRPGPFESAGAARDRTEPVMLRESRAFVRRLQQLQIPVHADFYGAGVHDWPYWERELGRALGVLLPPIVSGS